MSPDPSDSSLDPVAKVLQRDPNVVLAYAFGSVAAGTATLESDLDVAVLGVEPLTTDDQTRMIGRLAEASGRPVDLIDLWEAGMPLLQIVLTTGRELVCHDLNAKASLMSRMVTDAEDFLPLRRRLLKERRDKWIV